jgi:transposase
MYIETRKKGNSITVLLIEAHREGKKIVKRVIANLSKQDPLVIENLKIALKNKEIIPVNTVVEQIACDDSLPCGHVEAVVFTMDRLGVPTLIDPNPSQERNIILGLIASRILRPVSECATSLWRPTAALAEKFNLQNLDEDDINAAKDWLRPKQEEIENKLAKRHLNDGDLVFLYMASSHCEGDQSSLIDQASDEVQTGHEVDDDLSSLDEFGRFGDQRRGKAKIRYSLMTDKSGTPISIEAFLGNATESTTFPPTVEKIQKAFGLSRVVMVGDWGTINGNDITILRQTDGVDWIGLLRSTSVRDVIPENGFQFEICDDMDLREFTAPEPYPGERLIAWRDYELKVKKEKTRESLLKKAEGKLDKIVARVKAGRLENKDAIAMAVGRVMDESKVKNYFTLKIDDGFFSYSRDELKIKEDKALDGICVVRASLSGEAMSKEDCVRRYENLATVERALRTTKSVETKVRPIDRRLDDGIRTNLFVALMAYYVEWHMRQAWRELTFSAPELAEVKKSLDPVKAAEKSLKANKKSLSKTIDDSKYIKDDPFDAILYSLSAIHEIRLVLKNRPDKPGVPFKRRAKLTPLQQKAFDFLESVPAYSTEK